MEKLNKILISFSIQLLFKQFKNFARELNNEVDFYKKNFKNHNVENFLKEHLDVFESNDNQILQNTICNLENFSRLENSKFEEDIKNNKINKNICNPIQANSINNHSSKNNQNSNVLKNLIGNEIYCLEESDYLKNNEITNLNLNKKINIDFLDDINTKEIDQYQKLRQTRRKSSGSNNCKTENCIINSNTEIQAELNKQKKSSIQFNLIDSIESQNVNNNLIIINNQRQNSIINSKNDCINFQNTQLTDCKNYNINIDGNINNNDYIIEEDLNLEMKKSYAKKLISSSKAKIKENFLWENYNSFNDEIEEMKFFEDKYINSLHLFPNYHLNIINKKDLRSLYNVNNLLNLQLKYEKKLLNFNPNLFYQTSFLNLSPFEDPKLNFFAYVFDIDNIKSTSEIYFEEIWGKTLKDFLKICSINKNPIQLIEISSVNTMLVRSSGKVYCWGWGLKNKKVEKKENNNDNIKYKENDFENINYKIYNENIERISDFTHDENLNNQFAINCNLKSNKNNSEATHDFNSNFINETNLNLNINTQRDLSIEYLENDLRMDNLKIIDNHKINKENLLKKQKIDNKNRSNNNEFKNNSTFNTDNFNPKHINKFNSGQKTKEREIKKTKINTRNSDMILNKNFKNKREGQKDISDERYYLEDNNVKKNLDFSYESQKDKSAGELNKNIEITFYDNKSLYNDKNENLIHKKDINNEYQTKINKKINENIFKKNDDFIKGLEKIEYELKDNFKNLNKNSIKNENSEIRNSALHSSINTIRENVSGHFEVSEYIKNKQKIVEQIFSKEILELNKDKISGEFNYIKKPILIENLLCRNICLSEDFAIFVSKSNINLHLMGNNEKNNLAFGNKIFIDEPVDYFNNIKNQLNKKFDIFQNDPNSTPEDFENLFRIADDFSKTFFNKTKIVTAKSYGKGFIILDNKGNAYFVAENFCENLLESIPQLMNNNTIKISEIDCGKNFSIFLSTTGQLYSQGENKYGQLGQGDFENRNFICEVPNFKEAGIKTVQISCGFKHVVIRASNNKVYTWGNVKCFELKIWCLFYILI